MTSHSSKLITDNGAVSTRHAVRIGFLVTTPPCQPRLTLSVTVEHSRIVAPPDWELSQGKHGIPFAVTDTEGNTYYNAFVPVDWTGFSETDGRTWRAIVGEQAVIPDEMGARSR